MLVRLRYKLKEIFILFIIIVLSAQLVIPTAHHRMARYPKISQKIMGNNYIQDFKDGANFRVDIPYPEYYMEYWEIVNLTIEITELKKQSWNNISTKLEWTNEGKLFLADNENKIHFLGDIEPKETITTNYSIRASLTKLEDPLVIGHIYVFQDGMEQVVKSYSWFEGEYSSWGDLNYGLFGIEILYPLMTITGPLEVGGVLPVVELAFSENLTLTYNITNSGKADLKNLTFQSTVDKNLIEITFTSFTSLETLQNNSFVLYEIKIRCKAEEETETVLYFHIETDILGLIESSVQIEIVSQHYALNYDNILVFYSWPIFILLFAVLALIITVFSFAKRAKTIRIEKELEDKYGKSYID